MDGVKAMNSLSGDQCFGLFQGNERTKVLFAIQLVN